MSKRCEVTANVNGVDMQCSLDSGHEMPHRIIDTPAPAVSTETPPRPMTDELKALLMDYLRAGQALRGDMVQIVPDIASRAMKLDRVEEKIFALFERLSDTQHEAERE